MASLLWNPENGGTPAMATAAARMVQSQGPSLVPSLVPSPGPSLGLSRHSTRGPIRWKTRPCRHAGVVAAAVARELVGFPAAGLLQRLVRQRLLAPDEAPEDEFAHAIA